MQNYCENFVRTEVFSFTWNIDSCLQYRVIRNARRKFTKDRFSSPQFGTEEAGFWRLELSARFEGNAPSYGLSLLYADKLKRGADISVVFLDERGREMPRALKVEAAHLFDVESNRSELGEGLDVGCMSIYDIRLKITIKVHCALFGGEARRGILQVVQRRCLIEGSSDDDGDDNDDSALTADDNDNQSTVSSGKLPASGGAPDASASSSLSLPSPVETTNDENSPCCIVPGGSMQMDVSKFAVDPRTSDLTVVCEGRKFRCHRFILAARSEVFKAMLYGEFVESKKSEIEINDIPSECVEELLTFLATDTCPSLELPFPRRCEACKRGKPTVVGTLSGSNDSISVDGYLVENGTSTRILCTGTCRYVRGKDALYLTSRLLNLLVAADKYQVPELSSKCSEALARCICYRTVLDILDRAELFKCNPLIDACGYYIKNCNKADKIVFEFYNRLKTSAVIDNGSPFLK